MPNIRRERFLKIATNRTNKILDDIRLLGNCSNENNYEFTKEDVEKMFNAIQEALNEAKLKFGSEKKEKFKF